MPVAEARPPREVAPKQGPQMVPLPPLQALPLLRVQALLPVLQPAAPRQPSEG